MFIEIYETLLARYGPQGWWPVTPPGERTPRYTGGPDDPAQFPHRRRPDHHGEP